MDWLADGVPLLHQIQVEVHKAPGMTAGETHIANNLDVMYTMVMILELRLSDIFIKSNRCQLTSLTRLKTMAT